MFNEKQWSVTWHGRAALGRGRARARGAGAVRQAQRPRGRRRAAAPARAAPHAQRPPPPPHALGLITVLEIRLVPSPLIPVPCRPFVSPVRAVVCRLVVRRLVTLCVCPRFVVVFSLRPRRGRSGSFVAGLVARFVVAVARFLVVAVAGGVPRARGQVVAGLATVAVGPRGRLAVAWRYWSASDCFRYISYWYRLIS